MLHILSNDFIALLKVISERKEVLLCFGMKTGGMTSTHKVSIKNEREKKCKLTGGFCPVNCFTEHAIKHLVLDNQYKRENIETIEHHRIQVPLDPGIVISREEDQKHNLYK